MTAEIVFTHVILKRTHFVIRAYIVHRTLPNETQIRYECRLALPFENNNLLQSRPALIGSRASVATNSF